MIDATEDKHLWSENYDRDLQDIFAVQSDIAGKVAEALKVELLAEEKKMIKQAPTMNAEANLLFLKGMQLGAKGTPLDLMNAIQYLERAVELDPKFALAHASIAYCWIGVSGEEVPGDLAFPKAKSALDRALALDPNLAEVQMIRGMYAFQADQDWEEAEKGLRKAIELRPSFSEAHDWFGRSLAALGRLDEAISEMQRAYELDPVSAWTMGRYGQVLWMAGKNAEAREMFNKALANMPDFARAYMGLAMVDATEGKMETATSWADESAKTGGEAFFEIFRALVYAVAGRADECRRILSDILASKYPGFAAPGSIAAVYYALGDQAKGYDWVTKAVNERDPSLPWFNNWPIVAAMRKDPRYLEILRKLKLP